MPKVSVLMPAYNAAPYIKEAVQSILNQTFSDYEFLICDDGSEDSTLESISSFHDPRIRLLKNKTNQGLSFSRNKLVKAAQGQYIAWLDADDIAYPHRLEKQVDFLEANSQIYIVSAYAHFCNAQKKILYDYNPPVLTAEQVASYLFFRNCLVNSSVMMRNSIAYEYSEGLALAEDYELWSRLSAKYSIAVLPSFLVKARLHENSTSAKQRERLKTCVKMIFKKQLERYALDADTYLEPLCLLASYEYCILSGKKKREAVKKIFDLLRSMRRWNAKRRYFDSRAYKYVIGLFFEELVPHFRYRQRMIYYFAYYSAEKWRGYCLALYSFIEMCFAFVYFILLPKVKKRILAKASDP